MDNLNTPIELATKLIDLFPGFVNAWEPGELTPDNNEINYHTVFLSFTPLSSVLLNSSSEATIKEFCDIINYMVENGGDLENAVSTCFLEHASQVGVRKIIKPFLSSYAKAELR